MSEDEMRVILSEHMARFRTWGYTQLAKRVEQASIWRLYELAHVEGTASDGTDYQLDFSVCWNDKPNEEVRVFGDLSAEPQRPLWGFIPVYTPNLTDSFVIAPDGRFLFEDDAKKAQRDERPNERQ